MAAHVAIVTDSTCNLNPELIAENHIHVVPLYVVWGEESFRDGIDLTGQELFKRLRESPEIPKTSQVSPQDFVEAFTRACEQEGADEVICAVLSGDLSGTYASAIQAREQVDFPVHVIDTRQISWALGFPVLAGARAREQGRDTAEIVQIIQDTAMRSHLLFVVESLDYLHRGGRIGNASRLLGTALNIKPILEVREGIVDSAEKVRTRKRAIEHLLKMAGQLAAGRPIHRFAVIHGDVPQEAEALFDRGVETFQPQEAYLSLATAVLGVHVGPGTLGVIVEWAENHSGE